MSIKHYPDASPAPIPKVYAQYRVLVLAVTTTQYAAIAELEFRQTPGVAEQATGGTPSESSSYHSDYNGAKAFDNDPASTWNSALNAQINSWVRYDFPTGRLVRQVKMQIVNTSAGVNYAPTSFKLQALEGGSWIDLASFSGLSWTAGETKLFSV